MADVLQGLAEDWFGVRARMEHVCPKELGDVVQKELFPLAITSAQGERFALGPTVLASLYCVMQLLKELLTKNEKCDKFTNFPTFVYCANVDSGSFSFYLPKYLGKTCFDNHKDRKATSSAAESSLPFMKRLTHAAKHAFFNLCLQKFGVE
ncbi:uncharacterized protein A4U43_C05F18850 [Asparagus officinalis]|uniref:Uncharacterized protein n=1 Tax=Asparagus officinalis TaxID=4686 RepID=A0A5P1ESN2_ASPOF|nr:uncharacterized protein A4U43_C05F18850 [Asparagus officinalis]